MLSSGFLLGFEQGLDHRQAVASVHPQQWASPSHLRPSETHETAAVLKRDLPEVVPHMALRNAITVSLEEYSDVIAAWRGA